MSATPSTLYTALLKAMQQMGPVMKDAKNPAFRSSYASLQSVLNTIEKPLWDNGLLMVQRFVPEADGTALITEIVHAESGDKIGSAVMLASKDPSDPQKVGSAITYYRRYSLLALLGLTAEEDDDGNAAAKSAPPRTPPAPRPAPAAAAPASGTRIAYNDPRHTTEYAPAQAARAELAARQAEASTDPTQLPATEKQTKFARAIAREAGIDEHELETWTQELYGRSVDDLNRRDMSTLIEALQRRRNEVA